MIKLGITLGFLLMAILAGVWLSHIGKPYPAGPFSLHKLLALGAVIFAVWTMFPWIKGPDMKPVTFAWLIVTGLLVAILFATGALLSLGKNMSGMMIFLHRAATLLTLVSTAVTLWSLKK